MLYNSNSSSDLKANPILGEELTHISFKTIDSHSNRN